MMHMCVSEICLKQGSWGQHGAHLGPKGPRWTPCWPHELCYLGSLIIDSRNGFPLVDGKPLPKTLLTYC